MTVIRTYSDGKNVYSVDMMIAYVNIFKPKSKEVDIDNFTFLLQNQTWGFGKHRYSPQDVLNNPSKYKSDIKRINNADLRFPIITLGKFVVDGVHRLTKAFLQHKNKIQIYEMNPKIFNKFIISKVSDYPKLNIQIFDFIKAFHERFCGKN
jgi:hypothetical protein